MFISTIHVISFDFCDNSNKKISLFLLCYYLIIFKKSSIIGKKNKSYLKHKLNSLEPK